MNGPKATCSPCSITSIPADAGLDAWRGMSTQIVLEPKKLETGKVIYPYEKAIK